MDSATDYNEKAESDTFISGRFRLEMFRFENPSETCGGIHPRSDCFVHHDEKSS
jgi:hypothetical protein